MAVAVEDRVQVRSTDTNASSYPWAIFVVRLVLGIIFTMHGAQKVFGVFGGHDLAGSADMMGHMGISAPLAYLSILTELVGGIALILGLLSRVAAAGLFINMVVATVLVHFKNGFFLGGGPGPGYEYNLALMAMSLAIFIAGPGAAGMADWERKVMTRRKVSAEV